MRLFQVFLSILNCSIFSVQVVVWYPRLFCGGKKQGKQGTLQPSFSSWQKEQNVAGLEHVCVYPRAVTHWLCVHEQSCTWKKAMEGTQTNQLFGKLWVSRVASAALHKLCCHDFPPVEVVPPVSPLISPVWSSTDALQQSSSQGPGWGEVSHTGRAKYKHLSRYLEQGKWCRVTSAKLMVSVLLGRGAVLQWSSFKA